MPRIFKGSESTLRLLISKTGDYQALTEIKIKLYTTDIENAIEIIDGIQVCKNIAIITLAPRAFMGMEDGLINYIIDGATEDDVFHTERQSNYMLKSLSYINEDGVATQTMTIESNGEYRVTPNDGLYVDINVNVPDLNGSYDEGYGQGKTDGINEQKGKLESINITENGTYTKEDGYNEIVVEVPDLNGSYDEGYGQGKTDGVNEQKSKLESINITENGTYTKEDGYNQIEVNVPDLNGSYDEGHRDGEQAGYNSGYTQGQTDAAANARVLDVTENGNYLSKFSDPIVPTLVTGVYADGTKFYSYAELNGKVFNTQVIGNQYSRVELWYKGDNKKSGDGWNVILGCGKNDNTYPYQIRYWSSSNNEVSFQVGYDSKEYTWDENAWHHILIAKEKEDDSWMTLWIDEVKIKEFGNIYFDPQSTFYINGIEYNMLRNANGWFGMIKIDDVIFIPTADGFKNVNTGELLEVVQRGGYIFTDNSIKYGEGELYKTINVNVVPKINPKKEGFMLGYSRFTEVPEWVDFNGATNMARMFSDCTNLQTIPLIDTSSVSNMDYMFNNCSSLQTIPLIDTSNVSNMSNMFNGCTNLQTIPLLNTSNVSNMTYMFTNCPNLQTIPKIDTSNVIDMGQMFYNFGGIKTLISLPKFNCQKVTNMYRYFSYYADGMSALTDVGGWENLKCDWNDDYGLRACPNLTYQSCINILNGLYDFRGNGESTTKTLKVNPNFLTTVGDEISIGTAKGWTITA